MKTLSALSVLAGGFLIQPFPKAVASTLLWLVSRVHPAVSALILVALVATWRDEND
jgi:hypothetical protein